jgi:DNA (cytosine-5)-methyltransferase 1
MTSRILDPWEGESSTERAFPFSLYAKKGEQCMQITDTPPRSARFFAGAGGDMCGFSLAGLRPVFAVEMNRYRCQTLRLNFPLCKVFEGPIQQLLLANYPPGEIPVFFITFPCDRYSLASNMHGMWTGDSLYLEALREIVLHYPEIIILENVLGIKKFHRVMETFSALPLYYCTECVLSGEHFSLQRKARVFLILHRQPFAFENIEACQLPRPGNQLRDYLETDIPIPTIPKYVYTRLDGTPSASGKTYRDRPRVYDPDQYEPVNLFTNADRDKSLFLVRDERALRGVRPFHVREVANLHGFPQSYRLVGSERQTMGMVIDSVMPLMAYALGKATMSYFEAIPHLAAVPRPLGHRELLSERERQRQLEEALEIMQEPVPIGGAEQLTLWA